MKISLPKRPLNSLYDAIFIFGLIHAFLWLGGARLFNQYWDCGFISLEVVDKEYNLPKGKVGK